MEEYEFFYAFWHGLTAVFRITMHLFGSDIIIYALNNTGIMYNVGYIWGVISFVGITKSFNKTDT